MGRRGVSVLELLVALVVGGLVIGVATRTLARQQRFFRAASTAVAQRVQLRDATSLIPGELRAVSPLLGDVIALSDSAIELRAAIGAGVVCDVIPSEAAVDLAPHGTAAATLGAATSEPQQHDILALFPPSDPKSPMSAAWKLLTLDGAERVSGGCTSSPLVTDSAGAWPPITRLSVSGDADQLASVQPGAFARVLRRVKYRLYRASTGEWYLGYSEWAGAGYGVTQPVSGPFAPYRAGGRENGLTLHFVDSQGARLSALAPTDDISRELARITIVARTAGESVTGRLDRVVDSLFVSVAPRNR